MTDAVRRISIRLSLVDGGIVERQLRDVGRAGDESLGRLRESAQGASRALDLLDFARRAAGALALGQAVRSLVSAGDAYTASLGRLTQATGSIDRARDLYETLYRNALQTGVAVTESVDAFQRFAIAARAIGATSDQVAQLVGGLQRAAIVGGSSAQEIGSATLQLAQALASGRLQGDELRAVLEAMPLLAEALAAELGVSVGQLREMGAEGALTAERIFPALLRASERLRVMFDPEIMNVVIDRMVRQAGVRPIYYTKVTDVLRGPDGAVAGVRANYGEEHAADVVIDASGDGHVAWLAGARYEQGEEGDVTYVQPITLYFLMGGVDLRRTIDYACSGREDFSPAYLAKLRRLFEEGKPLTIPGFPRLRELAAQNGDYPTAFGSTTLNPRTHNNIMRPIFRNGRTIYDTTMHNVDMAYRVDATDATTLSEAIGSMRDFTMRIGEFHGKYVPGYEAAYVLQIADSVGVRETRRVVGEYMLTGEDVLEARSFGDSIGYRGATVDIHNLNGSDKTRMHSIRGGRLYQIPYRILVPVEVDGLLIAGRCVSADRVACGSIRQRAGCIVTGQAAGIAAALSCRTRQKPRVVPVQMLQAELRAQGAQV
jgi:tape measure domain-containing protein